MARRKRKRQKKRVLEPLVKPGKPIKPPVQVPVSPRAAYLGAIQEHAPQEARRADAILGVEIAYGDRFASCQTVHEVPIDSTSWHPIDSQGDREIPYHLPPNQLRR